MYYTCKKGVLQFVHQNIDTLCDMIYVYCYLIFLYYTTYVISRIQRKIKKHCIWHQFWCQNIIFL